MSDSSIPSTRIPGRPMGTRSVPFPMANSSSSPAAGQSFEQRDGLASSPRGCRRSAGDLGTEGEPWVEVLHDVSSLSTAVHTETALFERELRRTDLASELCGSP